MAANEAPLILICDDELPLRELIKAALGDRYRYAEAENVESAEAIIATDEPRAIVLDIMLPGKSGISFLTELRARSARIPVIIVSAWQTRDDERAAIGAGADAFLGKPFDPEDLATTVEALLAA